MGAEVVEGDLWLTPCMEVLWYKGHDKESNVTDWIGDEKGTETTVRVIRVGRERDEWVECYRIGVNA